MAIKSICAVSDCEKAAERFGWCKGHAARWKRHGNPLGGRWPITGCSVDGCTSPHKSKGFCGDHYGAFRRHGDPLVYIKTPPGALRSWLERNSDHTGDDCLEWPFAQYPNGYGHINFEGLETTAHRAMCRIAHGEPDKPELDAAHSCHNRSCCNPQHLRWATRVENMADKLESGTDPVGERNGAAKISAADVRQIRALCGTMRMRDIGALFGITISNVSAIHLRKSWAHLD